MYHGYTETAKHVYMASASSTTRFNFYQSLLTKTDIIVYVKHHVFSIALWFNEVLLVQVVSIQPYELHCDQSEVVSQDLNKVFFVESKRMLLIGF